MVANDGLKSTLEGNSHQAFLPIFATLLFALLTSPMLLAWQGFQFGTASQALVREGLLSNQVVIAQCHVTEHQQAGHRCDCRRG